MDAPRPPHARIATIEDCGLSNVIVQRYASAGITRLFEWQAAALTLPGVLEGKQHLVYTASTSAGKTLVAELLLLRRLETHGQRAKALVVLPLRALVTQKAAELSKLLEKTGLTVAPYMTAVGELPMPRRLNVAVCTFEKAGMIVQSMSEAGRLGEIVAVVIDELHLLGEGQRGANLERTIARLLLHARRPASVSRASLASSPGAVASSATPLESTADDASEGGGSGRGGGLVCGDSTALTLGAAPERRGMQIIGMSATLPNLPDLQRWLAPCACFQADLGRREVPLYERLVGTFHPGEPLVTSLDETPVDLPAPWQAPGSVAAAAAVQAAAAAVVAPEREGTAARKAAVSSLTSWRPPSKRDVALWLARPTCRAEQGVLVFCQTQKACEDFASAAAASVDLEGRRLVPEAAPKVTEVLEELEHACPDGASPVLLEAVRGRCAFYHAGMSEPEQKVVEHAFRQGHLRFLAATTSLSEGVNLPVRVAIIATLTLGKSTPLTATKYRQMIGRAGRKGLETEGYAYVLVSSEAERREALKLMHASPPEVVSQLLPPLSRTLPSLPLQQLPLAPQAVGVGDGNAGGALVVAGTNGAGGGGGAMMGEGVALLLLESIAGGLIRWKEDVRRLLACTLWATQIGCSEPSAIQQMTNAIKHLMKYQLIEKRSVERGIKWEPQWKRAPTMVEVECAQLSVALAAGQTEFKPSELESFGLLPAQLAAEMCVVRVTPCINTVSLGSGGGGGGCRGVGEGDGGDGDDGGSGRTIWYKLVTAEWRCTAQGQAVAAASGFATSWGISGDGARADASDLKTDGAAAATVRGGSVQGAAAVSSGVGGGVDASNGDVSNGDVSSSVRDVPKGVGAGSGAGSGTGSGAGSGTGSGAVSGGGFDELARMRDELDRVRRGGLQFTSEIHQLYLCVGDAANHDSISYPCFDAELLGRMIWGPRWDWDEKSVTLEACVADVHRSAAPALDRDLAPLCSLVLCQALAESLPADAFATERSGADPAGLLGEGCGSERLRRALVHLAGTRSHAPQPCKTFGAALEKQYAVELAVARRLWLARMLADLIGGGSARAVMGRFARRGAEMTADLEQQLTKLRERVSMRATAMCRFCGRMQRESDRRRCEAEAAAQARYASDIEDGTWWILESVLVRIKDRLWWGVKEELLGLLCPKIATMTPQFAQALYKAGYRDLDGLASSDEERVLRALRPASATSAKGVCGSLRICRAASHQLVQEAREAVALRSSELEETLRERLAAAGLRLPPRAEIHAEISAAGLRRPPPADRRGSDEASDPPLDPRGGVHRGGKRVAKRKKGGRSCEVVPFAGQPAAPPSAPAQPDPLALPSGAPSACAAPAAAAQRFTCRPSIGGTGGALPATRPAMGTVLGAVLGALPLGPLPPSRAVLGAMPTGPLPPSRANSLAAEQAACAASDAWLAAVATPKSKGVPAKAADSGASSGARSSGFSSGGEGTGRSSSANGSGRGSGDVPSSASVYVSSGSAASSHAPRRALPRTAPSPFPRGQAAQLSTEHGAAVDYWWQLHSSGVTGARLEAARHEAARLQMAASRSVEHRQHGQTSLRTFVHRTSLGSGGGGGGGGGEGGGGVGGGGGGGDGGGGSVRAAGLHGAQHGAQLRTLRATPNPKRQKLSAVQPRWMHDSDVAIDSDSTGGHASVQRKRKLTGGAAAAPLSVTDESRATVAGVAATGAAVATVDGMPPRLYRRVNVVPTRAATAITAATADDDDTSPRAGVDDGYAPEAHDTISLEVFGALWLAQRRFAFGLHVETPSRPDAPLCPPFTTTTICGVAVTWDTWEPQARPAAPAAHEAGSTLPIPVVYYLPLVADYAGARLSSSDGGPTRAEAAEAAEAWLLVHTAMLSGTALKVCARNCLWSPLTNP
jgi:hypothetical protein